MTASDGRLTADERQALATRLDEIRSALAETVAELHELAGPMRKSGLYEGYEFLTEATVSITEATVQINTAKGELS